MRYILPLVLLAGCKAQPQYSIVPIEYNMPEVAKPIIPAPAVVPQNAPEVKPPPAGIQNTEGQRPGPATDAEDSGVTYKQPDGDRARTSGEESGTYRRGIFGRLRGR